MRNRWLWCISLLFVAWLVWAETSFQFYEHGLGRELQLPASQVSLIAGSFLLPYGLLQVPVGRWLDQGRLDRWLWGAALLAAGFSVAFASSTTLAGLMLSRFGIGLACAVAFPASALLAKRTLPERRFPLAMGLTDSLLGWGAAFSDIVPMLLPSVVWRQLVMLQAVLVAALVALPVLLMAEGRRNPSPSLASSTPAQSESWTQAALGRVIQACLLYAWGGGVVFGLAQYGLISGLRGWSQGGMQWMSLTMSIGIGVGMLVAGWLGSHPSRRGKVLLVGTGLNVAALLSLVLLPEQSTLLFFGASLSLGLGLGASVLAFPLAEDAAPRGQTAFTVATVNTTGTVTGAVMAVVSGQILQSSAPGNLTAVMVVYGLLALFGVAVATWVEVTLQPQR